MRIALAFALVVSLGPGPRPGSSPISIRPMARANDFQRTAGVVRNGVLTVKLVAQRAQWRPASDTGVALPADAFGEEGTAPSVPGPLLRAKVGTRVEATIRNALPETLVVSGLRERGPGSKESPISVPPGESGLSGLSPRARVIVEVLVRSRNSRMCPRRISGGIRKK